MKEASMESFNAKTFRDVCEVHFVQDNQSFSSKGVLRGLHYQTGIYAQAKLVRVLSGEVLDVVVDLRPESVTYGARFGGTFCRKPKAVFCTKRFCTWFCGT
jgi:dTDP-4-dehydrorhamnose 3,5-epimerase